MEAAELLRLFRASFRFEPTEGQLTAIKHLSLFLLSEKPHPLYLLRGYAGTGKTTLVTTLVEVLPELGMRYVLLAPTGRAAKVLSSYTGKPASTIHRKIYRMANHPENGFSNSFMAGEWLLFFLLVKWFQNTGLQHVQEATLLLPVATLSI